MGSIAIIGGTGPEGLGLGLRFALSGEEVRLGSRQAPRASSAAAAAVEQLAAVGCRTRVTGGENAAVVDGADMVVLALPYAGVEGVLAQLGPQLQGKLVLEVVNPLVRENQVFRVADVEAGSAAEEIQRQLPQSQVVSAFKTLSAEQLTRIPTPLAGDILVCSDHADARARVLELVHCIPALRAVDAGGLINSRSLESITALLLNLNRRHHTLTSIEILGLDGKK